MPTAYSFDAFLAATGTNRYDDDPCLADLLRRFAGSSTARDADLSRFGARVAGPLATLAEESARTSNDPPKSQYDPTHPRID